VNLVLTGFMATGKSRVGSLVARQLGMRFVDMDDVIVERTGKPIARIFAEDGEERFRQMETGLARELAAQNDLVIATGGGCMLRTENREALGNSGVVVCLWAEPDEVWRRVGADSSRPLLPQGGVTGIAELLAQRRIAYEQVPNHVDTTSASVAEVAEQVSLIYQKMMRHQSLNIEEPALERRK
jgi:shikimate kinase